MTSSEELYKRALIDIWNIASDMWVNTDFNYEEYGDIAGIVEQAFGGYPKCLDTLRPFQLDTPDTL
jgi:Mg2+/Co2+ transporter CorC